MVDIRLRPARTRRGNYKKVSECENYYFLEDFINKKDLNDSEFLEYITKRYGTLPKIKGRINYIRENISYIIAHKLETILKYKTGSKEIKQQLEEEFNKIKNVRINPGIELRTNNKSLYLDNTSGRNQKIMMEKPSRINTALEEYINGKSEDEVKEILKISSNMNEYIKTNLKYVQSLEKYILFFMKYNNVDTIEINELDQMIEVLRFFVENLETTYNKFESYSEDISKYEDDIRSFYISGEENLGETKTSSLCKLYNWKVNKIKFLLSEYRNVLNSYLQIRLLLETKEDINIKFIGKTEFKNIEEEFLMNYYLELREGLKYYKELSRITTVEDEKIDELKKIYLNKICKD